MATTKSNKSTNSTSQAKMAASVIEDALAVPGFEPSLIDGENASDYEAFKQDCLKAVSPKDVIERVWVQDFMDYTWEAQRLRRMKGAIVQIARKDAVEKLVLQFGGVDIDWSASREVSQDWSRGDPETRQYVEELLEEHGLNLDAIMAQAMMREIKTLQNVENLISSYDHRRDTAIREIEKRRDGLARRARDFTNTLVQDAEVEILDAAQ
jgi:hypothetical protein